jgi:hypothetical protein
MAEMTRDGIVVGFCGVSDFSFSRRNQSRWNGIVWRESLTTNDKEFASKSNAPFTCENQPIPKNYRSYQVFSQLKNMQDEVMSSFKENFHPSLELYARALLSSGAVGGGMWMLRAV